MYLFKFATSREQTHTHAEKKRVRDGAVAIVGRGRIGNRINAFPSLRSLSGKGAPVCPLIVQKQAFTRMEQVHVTLQRRE